MEKELEIFVKNLCDKMEIKFSIKQIAGFDPITFDEHCVELVRNAAEKFGYSKRNIISGAGHDACAINSVVPSAMIMCPCVNGISHNEAEEIKKEWAFSSTNVLMHAVIEAAS